MTMKRDRPYDGQSHTDYGERGRQEIHGITMRDLADCFVRALCLSGGPVHLYKEACRGPAAKLNAGDVYVAIDPQSLSLMSVNTNLTCEVEKIMGIFPNLGLEVREDKTMPPNTIDMNKIDDTALAVRAAAEVYNRAVRDARETNIKVDVVLRPGGQIEIRGVNFSLDL